MTIDVVASRFNMQTGNILQGTSSPSSTCPSAQTTAEVPRQSPERGSPYGVRVSNSLRYVLVPEGLQELEGDLDQVWYLEIHIQQVPELRYQ